MSRTFIAHSPLGEELEFRSLDGSEHIKAYKFKSKSELHLMNGAVQAFEVYNEFIRANDKVFQIQLALAEPGTKNMIAFAYVKSAPLTDKDVEQWNAIRQSILLNVLNK